jgi:hypothetical protein
MNPLQSLEQTVRGRVPEAEFRLDPATQDNRPWFLDVRRGSSTVTVEWRAGRGFGISANTPAAYGEGPDEVYPEEGAAAQRVVCLLLSGAKSVPHKEGALRELRAEQGVSQAELATRLGVQQASVSKLEAREDMLLSSLREAVAALGGRLVIRAEFPGGVERVLRVGPREERAPEAGACGQASPSG